MLAEEDAITRWTADCFTFLGLEEATGFEGQPNLEDAALNYNSTWISFYLFKSNVNIPCTHRNSFTFFKYRFSYVI